MFDYSQIPEVDRSTLQGMAHEIRDRGSKLANETCRLGKMLSEARDLIGVATRVVGGSRNASAWGEFCRHELKMEPRTARRLIYVFEGFGDSPPEDAAISALELLARPFVPASARTEAAERAKKGERIGFKVAHEIVARHGGERAVGSNRGTAGRLSGVSGEKLYAVRSAVRIAIQGCPPESRLTLIGELHELVDNLWREVEAGESPVGRGASRQGPPPDASEIANRCAAIRDGWSDDERDRRRRA